MQWPYHKNRHTEAFTLIEVLVTSFIFVTMVAIAMSGFFAVSRENVIATAQADLDLDARHLVERLRADLWRTSTDEILVYPEGQGAHTAISFPILHSHNETNPVPRNPDGSVAWDAEVIYHFWAGPPAEVRRTTFSPRGETNVAARLTQLEQTVADGDGSQSIHSANASTRTLIENLVDWRLNTTGPSFDGYAATPGRRTASFGSAILTDGAHDFTFKVKGKNSLSDGHRIGIDWLSASPSGSVREGERQNILSQTDGTLSNTLMTNGYWSGNYYLDFDGEAEGVFTLQMESDRWEAVNLFHTSAYLDEGITRIFDESVSPHTYALQLTGNQTNWLAAEQTGDNAPFDERWFADLNAHGTSVRVLLRGADILEDSGFITVSGTNAWFTFRSGASHTYYDMRLYEPFIAISDPDARMSYDPSTRRDIKFGNQNSVVIAPMSAVESDPVPIMIHTTNSYVVGFLVQPEATGYWTQRWRYWENDLDSVQSYLLRNATEAEHQQPDWSGTNLAVTATNRILTLESVRVGHAPEGLFQSRIFDTRNDALSSADDLYRTLTWTADTPANSEVDILVRAGSTNDLSDAPWSSAISPVNGNTLNALGRYVQLQVRLLPGGDYADKTPVFRDFILRWEAETRSVDVGGIFSTGPDHGIVELLIDGAPLIQAVTVNLSVYKDVAIGDGKTQRYETSAFAEIGPRNTRGVEVEP